MLEAAELAVPEHQLAVGVGGAVAPDAAAGAEAVESHVAGSGVQRRISSAAAGITTIAAATRNHTVSASVPAPSEWITPRPQAAAVKRCRVRQRCGPIRPRT